ncbi:hypothetical protein [Mycoplasma marinum]|uniref:Uncharacterized protein n=1 Tax=Mycoplasma marinum TaxID=1937190 RepID=A0A4R0XSL7_9MOLU|nr:hypothetical protein [Mycoplasma marinum]TCG10707.1 hypothetical protein C4B24_04135 [Mycoplasma marinum]
MFKRKYNLALRPLIWAKYRTILNSENIETLSSKRINKIFENEDRDAKEWYLHLVVSQWFSKNNEILSRETLDKLHKIIKRCKLNLNEMEKHDLLIIEERIFSSERTLKILDTNHKLMFGEHVNARFKKCNLFIEQDTQFNFKISNKNQIWTNKKYWKIKSTGILLISNKKFIIETKDSVEKILFKNIIKYKHTKTGFEFKTNDGNFLLKIHDQETLNRTINSILRKRAKNVIKKCKNN